MAFAKADVQSAIAKLAADFSAAELEGLVSYLSEPDDEVAGFGWDPAGAKAQPSYLLQRIEAHPGFKPPRLGYTDAGRVTSGLINLDEGETI